jgi:hypothetical protein
LLSRSRPPAFRGFLDVINFAAEMEQHGRAIAAEFIAVE